MLKVSFVGHKTLTIHSNHSIIYLIDVKFEEYSFLVFTYTPMCVSTVYYNIFVDDKFKKKKENLHFYISKH